ncbi:MAG: quaternary ammonium compound efflux SMR transporter SugE [Phycisphaerae bacterium]
MAWTYLFIAGLLEVAWAVGLKYSHGFTRPIPTIWTIATMIASFWMLALAQRALPLGTSYAVWTGIGVIGTTILGIVLFNEPRDLLRLGCIGLILCGIVGLKALTRSTA